MKYRSELYVVSVALLIVTLSVNLQVPLYRVYAESEGFGGGFMAVLFGAYILGLIPVLISFGGISEQISQKWTLVLALLLALTANVLVLFSQQIAVLLSVRLLQGAAVGFALGASAAFMAGRFVDLGKAANLHGIVVALGLGGGALLTSVTLVILPSVSIPASYYGVSLLNVFSLILMLGISQDQMGSSTAGLIRLPVVNRKSWVYCVMIFGAWSLTGVMIAIVPSALQQTGFSKWSGLVVFLSVSTGAFFQPLCRKRPPAWALRWGGLTSGLAYLILYVSIEQASGWGILVSAALAGASGLGFIYIGGLVAVMAQNITNRARAVSGYFLFGYLGLGLPCVLVGYIAEATGLKTALQAYGVMIAVVLAISWLIWKINCEKVLLVQAADL